MERTQYITVPRKNVMRVTPVERGKPDITVMTELQSTKEVAYFWLDKEVQATYCTDERPSITNIYEDITRELGMSWDETEILVRNAIKAGYLKEYIKPPKVSKKNKR